MQFCYIFKFHLHTWVVVAEYCLVKYICNVPNTFMAMYTHTASETHTSASPTDDFHSPVGAFISAKVWQNDALYRAFFSSWLNFFQSPFSFSRRAFKYIKYIHNYLHIQVLRALLYLTIMLHEQCIYVCMYTWTSGVVSLNRIAGMG